MTRLTALLLAVVLAAGVVSGGARPPLARDGAGTHKALTDHVNEIVNRPAYQLGRWGILVVDAASGDTLYELNPDRLATPASVTKLFSCSAALGEFGPDYRFETPVYRRGHVDGGKLYGDLVLRAAGDLTFGGRTDAQGRCAFTDNDHTYATPTSNTALTDTDPLAALKELAKQVADAGIKNVTGDVLIDDRLFNQERGSGSGPDRLTPILVNDNVIDVIVTPAKQAGERAAVRTRPETDWVQTDADVQTVEAGRLPFVEVVSVGPQRFAVRGRVPAGGKAVVRIWPVDDPAGFARALFVAELRQRGVSVGATPLKPPGSPLPDAAEYDKLPRVAVFRSPPFAEAIKVTLKVSHNLYASTMPLLIASKHGEKTLADGLRRQARFLHSIGVDVKAMSFAGGAGGANADAVTPRATVQLLRAMAKRPEWPALRDGLPVLGVDGTLAEAVPKDSPARGQARAKTGTLAWVDVLNGRTLLRSKALAGELTTAGGRKLVLAVFLNDVPLPPGVPAAAEGKTLGKLCEVLYKYGP